MDYEGYLESINGYSSPLIIIKAQVKYKFIMSHEKIGNKKYSKHNDFFIFSNSDKFLLKSKNEYYKINIKDATINLIYDDVTLNKISSTYKGLKLPENIFNTYKDVKNLKIKLFRVFKNQGLVVNGNIYDSNVIKVNQISSKTY